MKKILAIVAASGLALGAVSSAPALECSQKTRAQSAFSKTAAGQEIYEECSCPGEYAPTYITTRDVKLSARTAPNTASATTACTLTKCAMVNCGAPETLYRVSQFARSKVLVPIAIELASDQIDPKTGVPVSAKIALNVGDMVETLGYVGEGQCTLRIQGVVGVWGCPETMPKEFQPAQTVKDENWLPVRGCKEQPTHTVWIARSTLETMVDGAAAASVQRWIYPMTQVATSKRQLAKMCPNLKLPWPTRAPVGD